MKLLNLLQKSYIRKKNEKTYSDVILLIFYFIDLNSFIFHQNMIVIQDIIPSRVQIKSIKLQLYILILEPKLDKI